MTELGNQYTILPLEAVSLLTQSLLFVSLATSGSPKFKWEDGLNLEDQLTADEIAIRDAARGFCQEKLMPHIRDVHRSEQFPADFFKATGAMGLLGSTIEGYGCPGVSSVAYGLIAREVERVDSG